MNPTLIFEIVIALTFLYVMLANVYIPHKLHTKNVFIDDLEASLTSLNYINFSLQDICNITSIVVPGNWKYNVSVNNTYICGNTISSIYYEIPFVLVKNGTIYKIDIKIGK